MGWARHLGTPAAKDNIISELEALSEKRLTHALRSIGCHIVIDNYNPARSSSEAIHELHASDIILEANFWERAAQNEPWATVLPQIISDVLHILGHTVTVRNPGLPMILSQVVSITFSATQQLRYRQPNF